jgi:hypothetical protein
VTVAQPNLFLRLHKWATRQDENFVTESLALVLQTLLEREPELAVRLVKLLSGGLIDVPPEEALTVEVRTQVEVVKGRPDLELRTRKYLVVVEVKVESDVQAGQLEGYRLYLAESGVADTRLILLTHYRAVLGPDVENPDCFFRWYEVAEWLDEVCRETAPGDPVSRYLIRQFLEFLEARNMTIAQVSPQLADGVRSLRNLLKMLEFAAEACKVPVDKAPTWETIGIKLDNRKYWVGVYYAEPEKLWFCTNCKIDPERARNLGVGEMSEEGFIPGRHCWSRGVELDSEDVHFFSRSKPRQMQWLEEFLLESMKLAKQIEVPE